MNSIVRVAACFCLLLSLAVQLASQTQQPSPQASPAPSPGPGGTSLPNADPFPSTYKPFARTTTVIRNATIMTAAGPTMTNASILLRDGKIAAVGPAIVIPADVLVIAGTGEYVTPGII